MSPRRSVADALATRRRLLDEASDLASTDGLEGMSLGRLGDAAGVSKSGVVRHFPSKEALQLRTLDHAVERFTRVVWEPAANRDPGLDRLRALCDAWCDYLAGDTFPGGCFISAVSAEFGGRSGAVRDAIAAQQKRWLRVLAAEAQLALQAEELSADTDPATLAFQLNALAVGANQCRQLLDDQDAPERSRRLMQALLDGVARSHRGRPGIA